MATYKIDSVHSEVTFKIKHLMISNVSGNFTKFDGEINANNSDLSDAVFSFEADIDSINTNNEQRDGHLKSADFFDVENHPKLSFKSTSFTKKGDDYELVGDFTLRGVTKSVQLNAEYFGSAVDPYGNEKHGFEISGKISRKEFGLEFNIITDAGNIVLSDDVKLLVNAQFSKVN
jgi:polyisoprenoid-binding protein YceI